MTRSLPKRLAVCTAIIGTLSVVQACSPAPSSQTQDIFVQDNNGQRRQKAQGDQLLWTIDMGGCTGHLIAPEYMMTANHCNPRAGASYRSGSAIKNGRGQDISVERVVESSGPLDFAILKIRWNGVRAADQKFPPSIAIQPSDLQMGTGDGQGDEIFTVGFPGDKRGSWGATYAEGRAKRTFGRNLQYNIGIINGNSGGGVWRKSDNMLVSLTNGGPTVLGQPGWSGNDKNDSNHWNHGAAMWNVYAQSRTLQDIFPGGRNRFAAQTTPTPGDTNSQNNAGSLFLAIGAEVPSAADSFTMSISSPQTAASVVMCQGQAPCSAASTGYTTTTEDGVRGDRKLYKTTTSVAILPGSTWSITTLDTAGQPLATKSVRFNQKI